MQEGKKVQEGEKVQEGKKVQGGGDNLFIIYHARFPLDDEHIYCVMFACKFVL